MSELRNATLNEALHFMRDNYMLDEVPGKYYDVDCIKFRQGKKTILSINLHETRNDFQIFFGKAERAQIEAMRESFPQWIQAVYDGSKTYHDGKWMMFIIDDLEKLDAVKPLIGIKKKPNRKPSALK